MLSRVADAIYWMSRYVERAENVARFLDVGLQLMLDLPGPHDDPWAAVLAATGDDARFVARAGKVTREEVVRFLTIDPESPNSILSCLRYARENARSVREVISSEMWEQVNRSYLLARDAASTGALLDEPHDFLTEVKLASHLFVGTTYLTMTHNEGWHFGRLGRLLERADQTSRLLEAKQAILVARPADLGTSLDENHWAALLKSVSALEMYRKRHGQIAPDAVAAFLLLDKKFPRSIRYCLNKGERSLHAITGTPIGSSDTLAERRLGRLNAECEYALISEILAEGLELYLDRLQQRLNDLGGAIHETFFAIRPDVEVPEVEAVPARSVGQTPPSHSDQ
jgi:uncharacterized alpha-E superfamily protein